MDTETKTGLQTIADDIVEHGVAYAQLQAIRSGFLHSRAARRLATLESAKPTVNELAQIVFTR